MAAPTLVTTYPANNDVGIPVGITILLYFDYGVDLETVKNSVALFGRDFDQTSGPDQALWTDQDTGDNPFFLASPGFKGLIPLKFELVYYTLSTTTEVDPGTITSQADEVTANVGHLAKVTVDPKYNPQLPADIELTLVVAGDPDNQDVGISSRTVFDIIPDPSNTGDGDMFIYGTWTGPGDDEVNVKVTTAGNIGTAIYKWWYSSAGEGAASTAHVTNRRFRTLDDGLQIRFSGSNFVLDDTWTFNVSNLNRMTDTFVVTFTTNDGSYSLPPSSPSTPATSLPPSTVSPLVEEGTLEVEAMIPENGSYNVSINNRVITITFSENLDPATITDDSVKLKLYPVSGHYDDTFAPKELQKTLTVSDNVLTIRF